MQTDIIIVEEESAQCYKMRVCINRFLWHLIKKEEGKKQQRERRKDRLIKMG